MLPPPLSPSISIQNIKIYDDENCTKAIIKSIHCRQTSPINIFMTPSDKIYRYENFIGKFLKLQANRKKPKKSMSIITFIGHRSMHTIRILIHSLFRY
jgi:hypothetical protein